MTEPQFNNPNRRKFMVRKFADFWWVWPPGETRPYARYETFEQACERVRRGVRLRKLLRERPRWGD